MGRKDQSPNDSPGPETLFQSVAKEVESLTQLGNLNLSPEQINRIFDFATRDRTHSREVTDRPDKRNYNLVRIELVTKCIIGVSALCFGAYVVTISITSAKTEAERSKLQEKLISELPAIVGGLGGGMVIGKQFLKRK